MGQDGICVGGSVTPSCSYPGSLSPGLTSYLPDDIAVTGAHGFRGTWNMALLFLAHSEGNDM